MFKESITKEELTELPLRWFDGEINVIEEREQVYGAINYLATHTVVLILKHARLLKKVFLIKLHCYSFLPMKKLFYSG